ncbi:MCP1 family protein [Kocuria palustris]|nr:MCP1 family protein [Kocuria palustris]
MTELTPVAPFPVDIELEPKQAAQHNTKDKLRKVLTPLAAVQKYLAYTFGVFLGIHACLVIVVPSLPEFVALPQAKQEVFEMARAVYHHIPGYEAIGVFGAALVHVILGVAIRIIRQQFKRKKAHPQPRHPSPDVVKDETSSDIGLGGLTALLGMGYRRSIISRYVPGLSPLAFLGYVLLPLALYHVAKFRLLPALVDGDLALVSLDYISYYLNVSRWGKWGNTINTWLLLALVWTTAYHLVSGWLRFNHKYSLLWKKAGYAVIGTVTTLAAVAVMGFKDRFHLLDKAGFMARSFTKYAKAALW